MLLRRGIPADDRGFTLVEVMVAVALLLVGVLGTITMVTGANAQTAVTKSREGAVNLAREITDAARGVDYDTQLTPSAIVPALQTQPGLADADPGTAGWQINRRGVTYTVSSLPICIIDASADGYGAHPAPSDPAAPSYCPGQTTGSSDPNPDDFRRMDVTLTWTVGARSYSLRDTTLIINPSGGIGPTVKSLCQTTNPTDGACPGTAIGPTTSPGITSLNFLALTSVADTTTWTRDDGSNPTDVSSWNSSDPVGTGWNYSWNIGTPAADSSDICTTSVNWTLDGNYIVSAQAVSGIGANAVAGPIKPLTVTINRDRPYKVCGLAGGYDNPTTPWSGHPTAVDLEWKPNPERDIVGYQVWRMAGGSDNSNVLVCDTSSAQSFPFAQGSCVCTGPTACIDTSPRSGGGQVTYEVTALDLDQNGQVRQSLSSQATPWATIISDQTGSNNPPNDFAPGSVTLGSSGGLPQITWPIATDPNTGDSVAWYRIYRDGTGFVNRYDKLDASKVCDATAGTCTYTDTAPHSGGDTYWVTAVDTHYDESSPAKAG